MQRNPVSASASHGVSMIYGPSSGSGLLEHFALCALPATLIRLPCVLGFVLWVPAFGRSLQLCGAPTFKVSELVQRCQAGNGSRA